MGRVTTADVESPPTTEAPIDPSPMPRSGTPSSSAISAWQRISFETARFAVRGLLRLLGLNGLYRFGRAFATLEWLINYKRRRRFARQLRLILGPDVSASARRQHTRRHFIRTRCDKLFFLIFDHLPADEARARFRVLNRRLLDEGLARGRGAYVALSHTGPQHVAGLLMLMLGYKIAGVRDPKEGALRRFLQEKLERKDRERVRYFYADGYPRAIYRCFQDNFVVGSAIDVHRRRAEHLKTVEVNVFGRDRLFLTGPLQMALRCGAPILQGLILSEENFHYTLELSDLQPEVEPPHGATDPVANAIHIYARNLETYCRRYPCHVSRL